MYDLVIIGGGPGGLAAGVYAARANLKTAIVEKGLPGGQMQNTLEIENYPGFGSIMGPELSERMHKQVIDLGVDWKQAEVTAVDFSRDPKRIILGDELLEALTVVIASGAQ